MNNVKTLPVTIIFMLFLAAPALDGRLSLSAQELSKTEKKMVEYVKQHRKVSIAFLEEVVNINSGTHLSFGLSAEGGFPIKRFRD